MWWVCLPQSKWRSGFVEMLERKLSLANLIVQERDKRGYASGSKEIRDWVWCQEAFHQDMPQCIKEVLAEFKDVFPMHLPLGFLPIWEGHEFCIDLEDNTTLVHKPIYNFIPLELEDAWQQIDYMLKHGYIRLSDSPYGPRVLFVPKQDGGLEFCIEYCWLNKKMIHNSYPLSLPEELFNHLGDAKVFRKTDLRSRYWQLPLRKENIRKVIFKTRWGLYELLVVLFWVTNAPS